jgi:hypothetical protein
VPVALGTRWVDTVAVVAAAAERNPPWNVVVSVVVLLVGGVAFRSTGATKRAEHGDNGARERSRPHRR